MDSSRTRVPGFDESLATKMDRLADALGNARAELRSDGVYVDVYANGTVRAIVLDEQLFPGAGRLGGAIVDLINQAREQAQAHTAELVAEVQNDSRIASVVERLGDAPERAEPRPTGADRWDYDDDPYRLRSRIAD
ncbi:YbaB/EbfC family nucleoid-associated protein [Nocardia sp. NPDC056000]|uniref:YbaB/EbfC family nucleoid-associated protein n=1 Tax=Nocardia sp. NPDC056000 TaxID=3345674 RepID=UPI0035DA2FBF